MSRVAFNRYLARHIESALPDCPQIQTPWRNVLVIPAYREEPDLLDSLRRLSADDRRTLVILVLNRPDSDPDTQANRALRDAVGQLPASRNRAGPAALPSLAALNAQTDIFCHDMEMLRGACPKSQGVGLARKTGFDIALKWISQEGIQSHWICSTDADAQLPADYFLRLQEATGAAVCFPFWHAPGTDHGCNRATALYELRLHYYALGLEYAGSPYAWHSLGSCLAVAADAYAQVRGFPRRAGAEDFYLLNKVAKTGAVSTPAGACITLKSRISERVPFGTGPAVSRIAAAADSLALPLFYHPRCFAALRALLDGVIALWGTPSPDLTDLLASQGLDARLAQSSRSALEALGFAEGLAHCRRQGRNPEQFMRQFHQWFDAFRTLRFIHILRASGWEDQPLSALHTCLPRLWPPAADTAAPPEELCRSVRAYRGWITPADRTCW